MNVYLLTETETGCYKWRAAIPAKYLRRRGHQVQVFKQSGSAHMPDVVVFFRGYYPDTQPLFEWCKRHQIRVVFDTDDALDLVPRENVNYGLVQRTAASYAFLLKNADLVTTTTAELAAHLRRWNPHVRVLPNSVDPEEWSVRRRHGTPRIGWTGSSTHFMDLAILLEAVRQLQKRHEFHFILQGISSCSTIRQLYELQLAVPAFAEVVVVL